MGVSAPHVPHEGDLFLGVLVWMAEWAVGAIGQGTDGSVVLLSPTVLGLAIYTKTPPLKQGGVEVPILV